MKAGKYDRSIEMHCPTCGGAQFEFDENDEAAPMKCGACNLLISRDELIAANGENIGAHLEQVKAEVASDISRKFRDAFKGSKLFKLK